MTHNIVYGLMNILLNIGNSLFPVPTKVKSLQNFFANTNAYSSENPLMCKIFICLMIVVFPDSPVPKSKIFFVPTKVFVYFLASSSPGAKFSLRQQKTMVFYLESQIYFQVVKLPTWNCLAGGLRMRLGYYSVLISDVLILSITFCNLIKGNNRE